MRFSFSIENWFALSAGLSSKSDWELWSKQESHNWDLPLPKLNKLPMMQARRMSITSLSANNDGFQQSLIEALPILRQKDKKVLLIDFDGIVPKPYLTHINQLVPYYAVGYILTNGNQFTCQSADKISEQNPINYPQSLVFLRAYLNKKQNFFIQGLSQDWQWTINT